MARRRKSKSPEVAVLLIAFALLVGAFVWMYKMVKSGEPYKIAIVLLIILAFFISAWFDSDIGIYFLYAAAPILTVTNAKEEGKIYFPSNSLAVLGTTWVIIVIIMFIQSII